MLAKDIIDLIIESPAGQMPTIIAVLDKAEYIHEGNKGISTREAFRPKPANMAARLPPHHRYACETGSSKLFRHLAFHDYLIARPQKPDGLANRNWRVTDPPPVAQNTLNIRRTPMPLSQMTLCPRRAMRSSGGCQTCRADSRTALAPQRTLNTATGK